MLTLITVITAIAFVGYHKKKKKWHFWLGFFLCFCIFQESLFLKDLACDTFVDNNVNQRLTECKQENVQMKKEQENLKKELIENEMLDDDSLNQFLNDYLELDNQILNSDEEIKQLNKKLKQKEKCEFLLFFNLF